MTFYLFNNNIFEDEVSSIKTSMSCPFVYLLTHKNYNFEERKGCTTLV